MQQRIRRSGEAHIYDAGRIIRRPLQTLVDGKRSALGFARGVVEGSRGEKLRSERDADELTVRGNGARHGGSVLVRFCSPPSASKLFMAVPARSGWLASISEIDHGDRNILSGRKVMSPVDLQLATNVLGCVVARAGWILGDVFLQAKNIVRLRAGDDRVLIFDRTDNVSHRTAAANAPAIDRAADERQGDRIQARQVIAPRHRFDRLRRNVRGNFGDDFVGNKAPFARRWHAAAARSSTSGRQLRGERRPKRRGTTGADDRVPWVSGVNAASADRPADDNNTAGIRAHRPAHAAVDRPSHSAKARLPAHAAISRGAAKAAHAAKPSAKGVCRIRFQRRGRPDCTTKNKCREQPWKFRFGLHANLLQSVTVWRR